MPADACARHGMCRYDEKGRLCIRTECGALHYGHPNIWRDNGDLEKCEAKDWHNIMYEEKVRANLELWNSREAPARNGENAEHPLFVDFNAG